MLTQTPSATEVGQTAAPADGLGKGRARPWPHLFERTRRAGLDWNRIRGVTSDGAQGFSAFLCHPMAWVQPQPCVWHI